MSEPQYAALQTFVNIQAPLWQERMGLNHFDINHVFLDSFFGDDGQEDFKVTACAEVRWNYLQAKIKWYLPSAVRHSHEQLEKTLVHELCHVLLAPEQDLIDSKLNDDAAANGMTTYEYESLAGLYYERMELATEMTSRAIWRAWA